MTMTTEFDLIYVLNKDKPQALSTISSSSFREDGNLSERKHSFHYEQASFIASEQHEPSFPVQFRLLELEHPAVE